MRTYAVHVPREDLEIITDLIRAGIFANRSEFVRAAIRDLLLKESSQITRDSD